MLSSDLRAAKAVMHLRTQDVQQQAQACSLLREAGIEHQGWFSRLGCRLMCQFGRRLAELGRRLERRYSLPQTLWVEG